MTTDPSHPTGERALLEALERIITSAFHQTGDDTLKRCLWCWLLASVEKLRPQGPHYDGCPVGIAGAAIEAHRSRPTADDARAVAHAACPTCPVTDRNEQDIPHSPHCDDVADAILSDRASREAKARELLEWWIDHARDAFPLKAKETRAFLGRSRKERT
jgi:hypothetical protein